MNAMRVVAVNLMREGAARRDSRAHAESQSPLAPCSV